MANLKLFNSVGAPIGKGFPIPITAERDPDNGDRYRIGQMWINTITSASTPMAWFLCGYTAGLPVWIPLGGSSFDVEVLQTDDGNQVTPAAGIIIIHGTHGLNTTGTVGPNTVTVAINNAITLGDLANLAAGVPALTIATGDITFTATNNVGNINMVNTVATTGAAGVVKWGGNPWIHNFGDNSGLGGNVFVGKNAGNFTTLMPGTATRLVGIGQSCLQSVTTGTTTVAIGYEALGNMTSGSANVAIGYWTMRDATTAAQNMCFGFASGLVMTSATGNILIGDHAGNFVTTGSGNTGIGRFVYTLGAASGLTTGNFNISIGDSSGQNFTGSESNNILLNSFGTGGDNNILRFGRATGMGTGELLKAFIQGIYGITPAGATQTVIIDSAGQLGSTAATGSSIGYTNVNTTPYVATSTDVYLGVDCSGGAITVQIPNVPAVGRVFYIKDRTGNAHLNNISVTTPSGVVGIDGVNTYVMNTQYAAIGVIFNNNNTYEIF